MNKKVIDIFIILALLLICSALSLYFYIDVKLQAYGGIVSNNENLFFNAAMITPIFIFWGTAFFVSKKRKLNLAWVYGLSAIFIAPILYLIFKHIF